MRDRLRRVAKVIPGDATLDKVVTRKQFVAGAGALGVGALLAACGGSDTAEPAPAPAPAPAEPAPAPAEPAPAPAEPAPAPAEPAPEPPAPAPPAEPAPEPTPPATPTEPPLKDGLADGMYGGPVGFDGAERYQYPLDSQEGRAIAGLRALVAAGQAPDKLVVQTLNFARPQFETAFPEGSKSHVQLFEEETGIKIEFIETDPASEYQENLRNASTRNGSFDLVTTAIEELGDFAEAGLLRPFDDFVAKYQPEWTDPQWGYAGGETTVNLFTRYKDQTVAIACDNDTQPYFYRADLLEDPAEAAAFADKYGRELRFPQTWEEQAEVAEFFTRPDQDVPLFGDVATLAPFWGAVNWNQRFVCSANPNQYYFNDDGSANVNNEAGIRAFAELLKSLEWHEPGALEKDWVGQYQVMGAGNGWGGGSFPNQTKLLPGNPDLDTANVGQFIKSEVSPGRIVDGGLIRRPVIFYNISYGINAFADPARHEAAYLFLQWIGGARIYTYLTANPGGYQDPLHTYSLTDPFVIESYKPQPTAMFGNINPRTAPPINIKSGGAYRDSLSEELQKVLTKQSTPEKAAKSLEDRWNKITEEAGQETQVAAWAGLKKAFPSVVDTPA